MHNIGSNILQDQNKLTTEFLKSRSHQVILITTDSHVLADLHPFLVSVHVDCHHSGSRDVFDCETGYKRQCSLRRKSRHSELLWVGRHYSWLDFQPKGKQLIRVIVNF